MAGGLNFGIELRGWDALTRLLADMGPRFERAFIRGMWKAVYMVERRAKEKLSGDVLHVRSGLLHASIRPAVLLGPDALEVMRAKFPQTQTSLFGTAVVGTVGSDVIYSRIHEFGGRAGRGHSVTIPARPYLSTSVDELSQDIIKVIDESVAEELRK